MPRKSNANSSTSKDSQLDSHETGFSTTEIHHQSDNIVKYILNNIPSKLPFKRQDIVKNVLNGNNRLFDAIFAHSCDKLKDIFGIAIVQVEEVKTGKQYITHSIFPTVCAHELNNAQQKEVTLLFLVLSYIFMKGSEINEITLFNFLDALHIKENENHTYFGNVTKYVQEVFPKQLYLKRTKVKIEGSDEDRTILRWGQRAELEFDKKEILQFVGRVMKKPPQSFTNQFGEVFGEPMEADVEVSQVIDSDDDEDM